MAAAQAASETSSEKANQALQGTRYECSDLVSLKGGNVNYLFRGRLRQPLHDGTEHVLIKQGERFLASNPSFKLPLSRCLLEKECLERLSTLPVHSSALCSVGTPRLLHYFPETQTQVQEYLRDSIDLKSYALKHLAPAQSEPRESQCRAIGEGLGAWLRRFHSWAESPQQQELRRSAAMNKEMQDIRHAVNYARLVQLAESRAPLLGEAKAVFQEVEVMAREEMGNAERTQVIHGDFWTGNIILPNRELDGSEPTRLLVVDWEVCELGVRELDVGQMVAEMYELKLFKGLQAGLWLIAGFVEGYGIDNHSFAERVAVHVGTHLVCYSGVPGWGSEQQVEGVMRRGRDLIVRAWQKDTHWLEQHELRCLFARD